MTAVTSTRTPRLSQKSRLDPVDVTSAQERVRHRIRDVPDFPQPGILFRDITPVLADPAALDAALALHLHHLADLEGAFEKVAAIESRGFWFGISVAERFGAGFVPIRKRGKLPAATLEQRYALEYGVDCLQMHLDAIAPGDRVVVIDDLLATGGTARAACDLVERRGARVVACTFLIELSALAGRERLGSRRVEALIRL